MRAGAKRTSMGRVPNVQVWAHRINKYKVHGVISFMMSAIYLTGASEIVRKAGRFVSENKVSKVLLASTCVDTFNKQTIAALSASITSALKWLILYISSYRSLTTYLGI